MQRAVVAARIAEVGGWSALQKDCDEISERHPDTFFVWNGIVTNDLPPAIAALKPSDVTFYPPGLLKHSEDQSHVPVVRIKVFGRRSGRHSIPYFGLEVVCGRNAESYTPTPCHGDVLANGYDTYRRVTDTIYEIY